MVKRIKTPEDILLDKTSGSMDLVFQLNKYMEKNSGNIKLPGKTIRELRKKESSFQAVDNYLKELNKLIKTGDQSKLTKFLKSYRDNQTSGYKIIYESSKHLLENKKRVLTISNSRTVLEFLKLWHNDKKDLEVFIAESRPMNEGRIMAKSLLHERIKVTFITDFNISHYISISDAVITGADVIFKNGNAVNKTGSRAAAIICRYFKKPFYVIASSGKFSEKESYKPRLEKPEEIWKYRHKNLGIKNNYFEVIEKKLITKILTEGNR